MTEGDRERGRKKLSRDKETQWATRHKVLNSILFSRLSQRPPNSAHRTNKGLTQWVTTGISTVSRVSCILLSESHVFVSPLETFTLEAALQIGAIYICAVLAATCRLGGATSANEDTLNTISHLAGKGRHIDQRRQRHMYQLAPS